jgi:hypothetical protein
MMKRILDINSEIEAQRIKEILDTNGISHIIRSFHDSVYDGIFQNQYGWGVLEADEADEKLILELVGNDIARPLDNEDDDIL